MNKIEKYLKSIRNKDGKYKRVSLSPLRYAGGKSKGIGAILEHIPNDITTVVSPFFGGGSVEIILANKLGIKVIGYDVFDMLCNYWKYQLKYPHKLANELSKLIPDKENFEINRHILLNYWEMNIKPETLTYRTQKRLKLTQEQRTLLNINPLLQATFYYYNMQLSYGPMFLGWASSVYLSSKRYEKIVRNVREFKCKNLSVECDSFENAIKKHPTEFLFCDPPYYLDGDSKIFKGMYPNCNFAYHHKGFDHEKLRDLLLKHRGGFILTYNNCETIRNWYEGFDLYYPEWQYTYGQGEKRIGKNREQSQSNIKKSHEIIIVGKRKL